MPHPLVPPTTTETATASAECQDCTWNLRMAGIPSVVDIVRESTAAHRRTHPGHRILRRTTRTHVEKWVE